ncbi:MAG: protein kinase, partial [Gammaproteobacteria bacterium]|nr:protein kinase [Gammaproteobacteria bacterium]
GISRPLQEEHTHCSTTTALAGKAAFVAPEAFLSADVSGKTQYSKPNDIYSLAILIWCCMSQQRPFEGWNPLKIMREVGDKQFRQKIPDHTPLKLAKLIEKSWAQDVFLRPCSSQISTELGEIYQEESARQSPSLLFPQKR